MAASLTAAAALHNALVNQPCATTLAGRAGDH